MTEPHIQHFHHQPSGTLSYVVSDPATSQAAVVDPVLGFSIVSGRTDTAPVQQIVDYVSARQLSVQWILETHAHADHLSGAQALKSQVGGELAIGAGICKVQQYFADVFNLTSSFRADGHQFDHLFADDEVFRLGEIECRVIGTPGHTSDSVTYVIGNAAFVGDTLFMPDFGTARCDFPGGDAGLLYDSIQKILSLPPSTVLHMCHDYPPESRELRYAVSIAEQQADNIHIGGGRKRSEFVAMRETRDASLSLPALILPSLQVNIRGGRLPEPEDNGVAYLKIPLDLV